MNTANQSTFASTTWTIAGSDGEPILGNTHHPAPSTAAPIATVVIAHGFKGYKDYGMFPALARSAADAGCIAHRFNFSHSGMTNDMETFARPDLFERETWSRQVHDLRAVLRAVQQETIAGGGLPVVIVGHSRGGVTALLTVGRTDWPDDLHQLAGVMTLAAPSSCNSLDEATQKLLLHDGRIETPSSRTGQILAVGADWLREQHADPAGHDVVACAARIDCPVCIVHGEADDAVPVTAVDDFAAAVPNAEMHRIAGANHVFNTPNPMPTDASPSDQLRAVIDIMQSFVRSSAGQSSN